MFFVKTRLVSNLFGAASISRARKDLSFCVPLTRRNLEFLKVFTAAGVFALFSVSAKNRWVRVFLRYIAARRCVCSLRQLGAPNSPAFLSSRAVRLLRKRSGSALYVLSTSRGLLTLRQAEAARVGGLLVAVALF